MTEIQKLIDRVTQQAYEETSRWGDIDVEETVYWEAAKALETLAADNERLMRERDEAVDMQAVGRGVMEAQACSAWHWFMAAWAPAMCPSEFVYDALNAMDEIKARADLAEKANGELRAALAALKRYVAHQHTCTINEEADPFDPDDLRTLGCNCGFAAAMNSVRSLTTDKDSDDGK